MAICLLYNQSQISCKVQSPHHYLVANIIMPKTPPVHINYVPKLAYCEGLGLSSPEPSQHYFSLLGATAWLQSQYNVAYLND